MNLRRYPIVLPTTLLLLLALLRPWVETSMALHMAVEFPLLFAVGVLFSLTLRPNQSTGFSAWNQAGLPCLLLSSLLLMSWMLPITFDAALLSWRIALLKVVSLLLAGGLTGWVWSRLHLIVRFIFTLNLSGMNILLGVLYLTAPQQLCSAYRSNEQIMAGLSLLAWGSAILIVFVAWWMRRLARST